MKNYVNLDDDDIEYARISMPSCVITNSNYIINDYNDITVLKITVGAANYVHTTGVPKGNYTKTTWISFFQAKYDSVYPGCFVITANNITNKFTITTTAAFQTAFPGGTWGFAAGTTSDYIWGFRTSFSTTATSFTMDRCFNFLPVARFVFHCNVLSSGLTMASNSSISCCDILAVIPNSSKLNSQIIYESSTNDFLIKSNSHISNIVISITDDDNRLINFNGISCYFVLQFDIFRKSIQRPLKFSKLVAKAEQSRGQYSSPIIIEE